MRKKMRAVDHPGWNIPKKSLIGIPWKVTFALQERGWILRSDIIWNRYNSCPEPSAKDRPHRKYEHIFLFAKTRFYSYDRSKLEGEEDVWNIPIDSSNLTEHNASFPSELVRRWILTGSPPGGLVLDPFVGSGTTLQVALNLGRHSIGIDLSSKYTSNLVNHLKKQNCHQIQWAELLQKSSEVPDTWNSWYENHISNLITLDI